MRTKIVYVLVSSGNDIYIEQAYMSIWSCKYYNPDATIVLATDSATKQHLDKYIAMKGLISEFVIHEFNPDVSNFERSRFLKTSLRSIIEGDFLFVDTDTIFCDTIKEIDGIISDIAMVENLHIPTLESSPYKNTIYKRLSDFFNIKPNKDCAYYNSGVIYSKDSQVSSDFYNAWHKNWSISKFNPGGIYDQASLLKTVLEYPDYVHPLGGIYNVQISASIKYLYSGKIIHFFNVNLMKNVIHPFLDKKYYVKIKQYGDLSEDVKDDIINCKSLFFVPTCVVGPENAAYWNSSACIALNNIQNYKIIAHITNAILRVTNKVINIFSHK